MRERIEGIKGEEIAKAYIRKLGYKILEENYVYLGAEADIIALDGDELVFIEVKCRNNLNFGYPAEAVTRYKIKQYILIAKGYTQAKRMADKNVRFDVIEVFLGKINHIKNAFEA
ncbi:MAG: YraN family protein [Clostridiales bacterium]|nr:YraN family protein [Clostridiales bacterium]